MFSSSLEASRLWILPFWITMLFSTNRRSFDEAMFLSKMERKAQESS